MSDPGERQSEGLQIGFPCCIVAPLNRWKHWVFNGFGQFSSVVEQRFCKPSVVGSSPTTGSSLRASCFDPAGRLWVRAFFTAENPASNGQVAVLATPESAGLGRGRGAVPAFGTGIRRTRFEVSYFSAVHHPIKATMIAARISTK